MPIPSPGTYDQASQATLVLVKAKTDNIGATVALEAGGNLAAVKAKVDASLLALANMEAGLIPTISGSWTTNPTALENIVDNNPATAANEGRMTQNGNFYAYIIIDLFSHYYVTRVDYSFNAHATDNWGDASIAVSDDSVAWVNILSPFFYTTIDTNYADSIMTINRIIRYVRFCIHMNSGAQTEYFTAKHLAVYGVL